MSLRFSLLYSPFPRWVCSLAMGARAVWVCAKFKRSASGPVAHVESGQTPREPCEPWRSNSLSTLRPRSRGIRQSRRPSLPPWAQPAGRTPPQLRTSCGFLLARLVIRSHVLCRVCPLVMMSTCDPGRYRVDDEAKLAISAMYMWCFMPGDGSTRRVAAARCQGD